MKLYNPYTKGSINYPLDLSPDNIVIEYYITHETFFCEWHTSWLVVNLKSGDVLYIPYGDRNRRDIYVVTPFYLNKEVQFPYGVYTLSYNEFLKVSRLDIPDNVEENDHHINNTSNNTAEDMLDDNGYDDDDDDFEEFFNSNNNFKPKYVNLY